MSSRKMAAFGTMVPSSNETFVRAFFSFNLPLVSQVPGTRRRHVLGREKLSFPYPSS
jgi:hypothetical protein